MVSSISSNASDSIQLIMAQMYQKLNAADTDGTAGLSKDELSSIDTSGDKGGSAFLQSLSSQFDSLDADGNGQLSASEIASAKPPCGPMGPPPGMTISGCCSTDSTSSTASTSAASSTNSVDSTSTVSSIEKWLEEMLQSLLDSFTKSTGTTASGDQTTTANATSSQTDAASKISSLTSTADTDKSGSLSLDELSSVDTSNNAGEAKFIKDLINNFKNYDTNGDGQLSQSEMATATPPTTAADLGSSLGTLSSSFIQKLLNNYQTSNLTSLASSIGIAG